MKLKIAHGARCLVLMAAASVPAAAAGADPALIELLGILRDNGTISEEAYELILSRTRLPADAAVPADAAAVPLSTAAPQAVPADSLAPSGPAAPPGGRLNPGDTGRFAFVSEDGDFEWRLGARVQLDAAAYENDRGTTLGSGTKMRRARLQTEARLWRDWGFKLTYDFAREGVDGIRDAYLRYQGFDTTHITLGHFKEPFGMERLTSVTDLPFMERSLASLFTPSRNVGLAFHTHGAGWTAAAGLFGDGVEGTTDGHESYGASGRLTVTPLRGSTLLHLGAGIAHRITDASNELSFDIEPESRVTEQSLVDTGSFTADAFTHYGAELAWARGPLSLQGEYILTRVDRGGAGPDLDFDAWYVQGGWFLSGESAIYSAEDGTFDRVRPRRSLGRGGWGAWQLGLRFSGLDLNDRDIRGGREHNLTLGLNWTTNPNLRFIAEYVQVLSLRGGPFDGARPAALQTRAQIQF